MTKQKDKMSTVKVKDGTTVIVNGVKRVASRSPQKAIDGTTIVWYYDDNGKVTYCYQPTVLIA